MKIHHLTKGCVASALLSLALTSHAMPKTEVIFAKGSNCGSFKGDLTSGKLFTVELGPKQALTVSTDGHVQVVKDSNGESLEDEGGYDYRYVTKHPGTHTVKMVGRATSVAEFCVT